jgi:hypothetical protein
LAPAKDRSISMILSLCMPRFRNSSLIETCA